LSCVGSRLTRSATVGGQRLTFHNGRLSNSRAEASVRGTLRKIEAEHWGGEQARQYRAGSLNPSKASTFHMQLSGPASALVCYSHRQH
jgi:hypothetical protein